MGEAEAAVQNTGLEAEGPGPHLQPLHREGTQRAGKG